MSKLPDVYGCQRGCLLPAQGCSSYCNVTNGCVDTDHGGALTVVGYQWPSARVATLVQLQVAGSLGSSQWKMRHT
jgi:hypothetical protein